MAANPRRVSLLRRWPIVLITTLLVATATAVIAARQPARYAASEMILISPAVSSEIARPVAEGAPDERLRVLTASLMSRPNLERTIEELHLYQDMRRTGIMEDVVEQMRNDMTIEMAAENKIRVTFQGSEALEAQRVAQHLSNMLIDQAVRSADTRAVSITQFLESEDMELKRRLSDCDQRVQALQAASQHLPRTTVAECDALQDMYKSLLLKTEQATLANNLQTRQLAETLMVLEPARVPERPIGLSHSMIVALGVAAGLGLGVAIGAVWPRKAQTTA